MNRKPSSLYSDYGFLIALLTVSAITLIAYSNTFSSPFQFDDYFYIVDNGKLRDLSNFWPPAGTRYIGLLSFAVNHYYYGSYPFSYHVVNTVIHIINGLLVYSLISLTFRTPWVRSAWVKDKDSLGVAVALLAAALFASHPVQTEAVTYITQRLASLAALFYLLTLVLYMKWRLSAERRSKAAYYMLSILSAIIAQKTKEMTFTLPFVIALYEFTFLDSREAGAKRRLLSLLPFFLTLAITPIDVFGPEWGLFRRDSLSEMVRKYQMKDIGSISRYDFFITELTVIAGYLRLLILPVNQNADYDVRLFDSIFEPRVVLSLAFILALAVFSIYLFARGRKGRNPLLLLTGFGVFWFFITISVESSIIPIKDIMVEHRLYLPSLGAALAFSSAAFMLIGYLRARFHPGISIPAAGAILMAILIVPLAVATHRRNALWRDVVTICEDVAKKSPNKATAHYLLGNAYYEKNRLDDAIGAYLRAMVLDPTDAFVHYKLYDVYSQKGDINEAMMHYASFKQLMSGGGNH